MSIQQDLSSFVFLKMGSNSFISGWYLRKGELPSMKLSKSTILQGPKRYFPYHSIRVSSLQPLSRGFRGDIWFSIMHRCSQVQTSFGTLNQGMFNLNGLFILTKTLRSILSQPLYTVLLLFGLIKLSLFQVIFFGVQVMRPTSSASENLIYYCGALFQSLSIERPLIIIESIIQQDYGISSTQLESFSTQIFKFLLFAQSIAFRAFYMNPASQYQDIYSVFRSAMAQRDALNILSRQSLTLAAGILQQDMILSGRQANRFQYRSLVPHSLIGNLRLASISS